MIIHVTAAGDTITSIADRYGVETDNLLADNGLNAGDPLVVGEAIARSDTGADPYRTAGRHRIFHRRCLWDVRPPALPEQL